MANYLVTDTQLTSVANAIRTKGGTNSSLAFPSGFTSAIENISTSDTNKEPNVRYLDYDGTVVATYTKAEFAQLQVHPANPTHSGLTAQGWNWTLADAQAYVASYDYCDIGQVYVTDDGKDRIYITITDITEIVEFSMNMNKSNSNEILYINWGDGSETEEYNIDYNTRPSHTYNNTGDYIISMSTNLVDANLQFTINFLQEEKYNNYITKIHWGNYGSLTCKYLSFLQYLTLPNNMHFGSSYFSYCYNLQTIIFPNTELLNNADVFKYSGFKNLIFSKASKNMTAAYCYNLERIILPDYDNVSSITNSAFTNCRSLRLIVIPNTITTINNSTFAYCQSLTTIKLPNNLETIGANAFSYTCLSSINIPNTLTTIGSSAFSNTLLSNIRLPNTMSSIGGCFSNCPRITEFFIPSNITTIPASYMLSTGLRKVIIPSGVTKLDNACFQNCSSLCYVSLPESLTTIGTNVFASCMSLKKIIIPSQVASIGGSSFSQCSMLTKIYLKPTIPPTITNTNVFTGLSSSAIIYVPKGYLETYQTANIWSTWASQMVEEE